MDDPPSLCQSPERRAVEAAGSRGATPSTQTGAVARLCHQQAAVELAGRVPVVARRVQLAGLPRLGSPLGSNFAALVRSIVSRQLNGPAARVIPARVVGLSGAQASSVLDRATRAPRGTGSRGAVSASATRRSLPPSRWSGAVLLDRPDGPSLPAPASRRLAAR